MQACCPCAVQGTVPTAKLLSYMSVTTPHGFSRSVPNVPSPRLLRGARLSPSASPSGRAQLPSSWDSASRSLAVTPPPASLCASRCHHRAPCPPSVPFSTVCRSNENAQPRTARLPDPTQPASLSPVATRHPFPGHRTVTSDLSFLCSSSRPSLATPSFTIQSGPRPGANAAASRKPAVRGGRWEAAARFPRGHWQSAPSGAGHARWASAGGAAASGGLRVEGQVRRRAVVMLPAFHFSTQYLPFQFPRQPELAAWPDGQAGPCALDKTRTRPLRVETGAPPAGPSRGHGDILVCRQEAALILAEQARR